MVIASRKEGFTLVELLIGIAVMGVIVGALYQVIGVALSSYHAADDRQVLVPQARYALERMVMFVQESDQILTPPATDSTEVLAVTERISNQYDNSTHQYNAAGDAFLDADNDSNGLINDKSQNPSNYITFTIDPANSRLMEQIPDYSKSLTSDSMPKTRIICENVQSFSCRRLLTPSGAVSGRVEITLKLKQGNATVTLQTTAKARWVD